MSLPSDINFDSLILKVLRRQPVARRPVWLMRQAGRYLPEYQEIRKKHRMLDVIRTPELAAEVTLQPIRRFHPDAAIIFADILNPLIGMGMELDFVEKEGPKIFNPIESPAHVEALRNPPPEENVGYTLEAIKLVVEALVPEQIPVLGFSGAPFTLSAYMIDGGSAAQLKKTKLFMKEEPKAWHLLQEKLTNFIAEYLIAQARAGVAAVQLFDTWVGWLNPKDFEEYVAPYLREIRRRVKDEAGIELIYFSTMSSHLLPDIGKIGFSGLSVDWRLPLLEVSKVVGSAVPLQGNFDPSLLFLSAQSFEQELQRFDEETKSIEHLIINLGHGILPQTPIENVARFVSYSRK